MLRTQRRADARRPHAWRQLARWADAAAHCHLRGLVCRELTERSPRSTPVVPIRSIGYRGSRRTTGGRRNPCRTRMTTHTTTTSPHDHDRSSATRPTARLPAAMDESSAGQGAVARRPEPSQPAASRRHPRRGRGSRLDARPARERLRLPESKPDATTRRPAGYAWLAGDHHIHTQYSSDAQYRVIDQARHASAYGLDWMVITDHGSVAARQDRRGARSTRTSSRPAPRLQGHADLPGPGVEHPGRRARHGLRAPRQERGRRAQGVRERLRRRRHATPASHTRRTRRSRSPASTSSATPVHQRPRRRRAVPRQPPGPPGHRLAARDPGLARRRPEHRGRHGGRAGPPGGRHPERRTGPARAAASTTTPRRRQPFPGYPLESYRTWGGFDWMSRDRRRPLGQPARRGQAVVDHRELRLAHGLPGRLVARGPGSDFNANGFYDDPVYGGRPH